MYIFRVIVKNKMFKINCDLLFSLSGNGGDARQGFFLIFYGEKVCWKIYHHEQIVWAILFHIRDDLQIKGPISHTGTWPRGRKGRWSQQTWVWILTQQFLSEQYHNKAFES